MLPSLWFLSAVPAGLVRIWLVQVGRAAALAALGQAAPDRCNQIAQLEILRLRAAHSEAASSASWSLFS